MQPETKVNVLLCKDTDEERVAVFCALRVWKPGQVVRVHAKTIKVLAVRDVRDPHFYIAAGQKCRGVRMEVLYKIHDEAEDARNALRECAQELDVLFAKTRAAVEHLHSANVDLGRVEARKKIRNRETARRNVKIRETLRLLSEAMAVNDGQVNVPHDEDRLRGFFEAAEAQCGVGNDGVDG